MCEIKAQLRFTLYNSLTCESPEPSSGSGRGKKRTQQQTVLMKLCNHSCSSFVTYRAMLVFHIRSWSKDCPSNKSINLPLDVFRFMTISPPTCLLFKKIQLLYPYLFPIGFPSKITHKTQHTALDPPHISPTKFFTCRSCNASMIKRLVCTTRRGAPPIGFCSGGTLDKPFFGYRFGIRVRVGPYRSCSNGNPRTLSIPLRSYLILSNTNI